MLIQHELNGSQGVFFVEEGDKRLAELVYLLKDPNLMFIDHTEVADALRGKNVGYQLVKAAADHARGNDWKIVARCPFAKAVFEKKPDEFADVIQTKHN